jgi:hypothetical protein
VKGLMPEGAIHVKIESIDQNARRIEIGV